MSTVTQDTRLLLLTTPLGKDVLLINGFTATERMSGLFRFDLELLATPQNASKVKPEDLLGKPMTVRVSLGDDAAKGPYRYFHGVVSRFAEGGKDNRFHSYYAEVVPWLWLLTQTSDCRIFQDKSVIDIVKDVLGDLQKDFPEFTFRVVPPAGKYTKRDYCVQYRETDFNFVSRLLEEDGLYYYFEHAADKHTLVIDDSPTAGGDVPNQSDVRFLPISGKGTYGEDTVTDWRAETVLRPGKYVLRDYHFQIPKNDLEVKASTKTAASSNGKLEMFDYSGEYVERFNKPDQRLDQVKTEGGTLVDVRMGEEDALHSVVSGAGYCRGFVPGFAFSLRHEKGKKYLLTSVSHSALQNPDYVSDLERPQTAYSNSFHCIPNTAQFRPPRVTPKPVVEGLQSALVVGKQGEEIWTDKYGRVKVQFYWDRYGKKNENSSCWVRVAQAIAGKRWGAFFLPRIGQEVLIAFMEGDPDQPIIVGSAYNADQMPHYQLPDEQTKSYIKTNSSKGGDGFNEIRFEDKAGKEQIFIHAERNMDLRVKNDSMERVIGNRHLIAGSEKDGQKSGDQRELVYQDKHLNVKRHQVEQIEGNYQLMIGNGEATAGGKLDVVVEKDQSEKIGGKLSTTVGGDHHEKVGAGPMMGNYALEAGNEIHLKSGANVVIEAGALGSLTLKGTGGFITIDPTGVTIQGMLVKINSGGVPGIGSGAQPQEPEQAQPTQPDQADDSKTGSKSC